MISTASAQSQPEAEFQADPLMATSTRISHSFRRREVTLARVSLYIVVIFLVCHGVRIFPNMFEMVQVRAVNNVPDRALNWADSYFVCSTLPAEVAEQLGNLLGTSETKVSSSTLFYPVCPSIADVQQLGAILSVAGVDLARDEREPPAARPRLLDQLLRLLRQTRPEEVLSLDTRIDGVKCLNLACQ